MTPDFFAPIDEARTRAPRLFVIVDTEEEFDWSAPFRRENTQVTAIAEVDRLQRVLLPHGVKPTYVVDYPVAATPASAEKLGVLARRGECQIGAHLHPWVTPPFDEPLVPANSFGCNLGPRIEAAKIAHLKEAIVRNMNVEPKVYKAGRYGFGPSTARILEESGFAVDNSVIPHMDFRADAGPSYLGFTPRPARFGNTRQLLELPCTTGFIGTLRSAGEPVHRAASASFLKPARAVGLLAKTGILNKVMLSPEGNTFEEMRALTRALHADGLRTFAMTLHSPSLKPGCTIYVNSDAERDAFLSTIDRYCDFFFNELGGTPTTAEDLGGEFVS